MSLVFKDNYPDQIVHLAEYATDQMPNGVYVSCDGYKLSFTADIGSWDRGIVERWTYDIRIANSRTWHRWWQDDNQQVLRQIEHSIELAKQRLLEFIKSRNTP